MSIRGMLLVGLIAGGFSSWAQNEYVTGTRSNYDEVTTTARDRGKLLLEKEVGEFANGNTYVRLSKDVAADNVDFMLPTKLTSDSLMEALITIFTLKRNGAHQVRVHMAGRAARVEVTDLPEFESIAVDNWLKAAGADELIVGGTRRSLRRYPIAKAQAARGRPAIVQINHSRLARSLGDLLDIEVLHRLSRENIRGRAIQLVGPAPEPVNASFFRVLMTAVKIHRLGPASLELLTPYLPYSRSDKVDSPGTAVVGKLIASLIEASGVTSVSFVRSHAAQAVGFFNIPADNISGRKTINRYLKSLGVETVTSPDTGFEKDATLFADENSMLLSVINKQRDPVTGKLRIVGISGAEHVKGRKVVIIDDETASGGTLAEAAEYLVNLGAEEVYAVVTHLAGHAKSALNSPHIKQIIVTNTLPVTAESPKLKVLDISEELARNLRLFRKSARTLICDGALE